MSTSKQTGVALALAAAGLFATAPTAIAQEAEGAAAAEPVHCYGVNACKGQNDCKTAKNACKGTVACKGQGFVAISKEDCDAKGGTVGE
ncbi:MAG: BufA2 family periplasmic bufferin-type metallophore [Gammaproteobacteria bacterium]